MQRARASRHSARSTPRDPGPGLRPAPRVIGTELSPLPPRGPGLQSQALTLLAFTDSGWLRRCRVPQLAAPLLVALRASPPLRTVLSVSFAAWAMTELIRLRAVERENRSLTTQLQLLGILLLRPQSEMSRLHQLETSLRAAAGLAQRPETNEGAGYAKRLSLGKEDPKCSRSSC